MLELSPSSVGILGLLLLVASVFISYARNPLRKVPAAHALAHFTSLWIDWVRWRSVENTTLKAAHDRLGPIVCLGPNEISVNCVKGGIREVIDNMFSTGSNKPHSQRKRMLSNIYSKSHVLASDALAAQVSTILYERFLPYLESTFAQSEKGVLNIYALLSATTMDIVTCYIFGLRAGSNLIDDREQLAWFLDLYNSRRSFNFWPQEFPRLTSFAEKWLGYRFTPKWVDAANGEIEKWTAKMCDDAGTVLKSDYAGAGTRPVVYQQLQNSMANEATKSGKEAPRAAEIASEVLDHLAAGFDTSGITLNYMVHELSQHPEVQERLQRELSGLPSRVVPSSAPELPEPKVVDSLPLLHAVIWETLRLHSAIPGPQPRFTPAQGCHLGPEEASYHIPSGVRVSASAGLLHLNEQVYEHADEWRPERWLDMEKLGEEKRKDMESRWFWAFGSGGRMCVGSHLAVYQMKYIIAALYSNYRTTIVDDSGIGQSDSYTAPPKSDKLMPSSSEKESRSLPRRCQNQWALGLLSPFDAGHASRLSPRIMSFCVTSYNLHGVKSRGCLVLLAESPVWKLLNVLVRDQCKVATQSDEARVIFGFTDGAASDLHQSPIEASRRGLTVRKMSMFSGTAAVENVAKVPDDHRS
ncbi:cytochrome P450 [Stemphylium lycopersici]|nr:cytochrome p450 monooxygenase [Stemphylium lycopersici]RAR05642.1 cytochrome P450 [Stemphylium lycopersici]